MREFIVFVLAAVSESLANYRYGLMNGQKPLGDEATSTSGLSVQQCGKFCSGYNSPALLYQTDTRACTCYSKVTGYENTDSNTQNGYVEVDETYTTCLQSSQHETIITDMVYGGARCPSGFEYNDSQGWCCKKDMTEADCKKYIPYFTEYYTKEYEEYDEYTEEYYYETVIHCHVYPYDQL